MNLVHLVNPVILSKIIPAKICRNRSEASGVFSVTTPQETQTIMRCEETQELIPAYIDRDLDVLKKVAVETHVSKCEACRGKHAEYSNLRWSVQTHAQYFSTPDHLKSRIRKQISEV